VQKGAIGRRGSSGSGRVAIRAAGLAVVLWMLPVGALAAEEPRWVGGDLTLNVRTGPGTRYRIIAQVPTGEGVTLLEEHDGWARVRLPNGREGWMPSSYLGPTPPPRRRLALLEAEVNELRERAERAEAELSSLREIRAELEQQNAEQARELEALRTRNRDLEAGARWPYLISGAAILATGMLAGAILRGVRGRRQPRIRL